MLKPVEQNTFRPISDNIQLWTVNTTTEKQVPPHPDPRLDPSRASSTEEHNPKRNETTTIDLEQHNGNDSDEYDSPSDEDDLHFKAQLRNPLELGESNAESAERTRRIEEEVEHMKMQRQRRRQQRRTHPLKTRMNPADQYTLLPATYEEFLANPEPYRTHPMWDLLSPVEYYVHKDAIDKEDQNEHSNNTQEYLLDTTHILYENQDKPVQTQQIDILHDTGASITMLPFDFDFAWTNVSDSLHTISGCLKGTAEKYTQIGKFHALITLDTGETKCAIIPEAILIPSIRTSTYLLAHAPLLMAGHEFILNLYKPKIKFREGGEYTMTVRKGHQIIKLLPINAEKETAHPSILIHNREPYDPPTFINSVLSTQNANRPDVSTPTALIYHLRYGCMSEPV
jgi:hypothetical protein